MAEFSNQKHPKVFISYSWKSEEYKDRVLKLAIKLRGDGVDVILDRWHLKYGMNRFFFMENNIRNSDRVLILCEEKYTEKADNKDASGVGIETNVITPEVYGKNDQQKFIPVIMEDPISLPIYLKGCLAVDNRNDCGYENILYAAYGVEMDEMPPINGTPKHIQRVLLNRSKEPSKADETIVADQLISRGSPIEKAAINSNPIEVNQRNDGNSLGQSSSKNITDVTPTDPFSNNAVNYYLQIADGYLNSFQCSRAIEFFAKAINILSKNADPVDKRMIPIYSNIAYAYHLNGAYVQSVEYYEKVLMINRRYPEGYQLDMAMTYNNIGDVYRDEGRYSKSLEYYNKALSIREKVLGANHSDTIKTKKNIEFVIKNNNNRQNYR